MTDKTIKNVQQPVSVILPAYDEEAAIVEQIEAIRGVLLEHEIIHEIIVIDDGSQDRTAEYCSCILPPGRLFLPCSVPAQLSQAKLR